MYLFALELLTVFFSGLSIFDCHGDKIGDNSVCHWLRLFLYVWQGEKGELNAGALGIKGEPGSPGLPGLRGPRVGEIQCHETAMQLLLKKCLITL